MANNASSHPHPSAWEVAEFMLAHDQHAQHLGVNILDVQPGKAVLGLTIRPDMINGLGVCHGGVSFALADTAFAFACNSRNQVTYALQCSISYTVPAKVGDVLTASAEELSYQGRTGVYDVRVSNQENQIVALFRGVAYRSKNTVTGSSEPVSSR